MNISNDSVGRSKSPQQNNQCDDTRVKNMDLERYNSSRNPQDSEETGTDDTVADKRLLEHIDQLTNELDGRESLENETKSSLISPVDKAKKNAGNSADSVYYTSNRLEESQCTSTLVISNPFETKTLNDRRVETSVNDETGMSSSSSVGQRGGSDLQETKNRDRKRKSSPNKLVPKDDEKQDESLSNGK